jgi:predicted transcriptional regulator
MFTLTRGARRLARESAMKRIGLLSVLTLVLLCSTVLAGELKVGDKAADFSLQDPEGKQYTLEHPEFQGKVLSIFYVDPDEADMNEHVSEALKKTADAGILDRTYYKGFGITNLKATWKPNFIIRAIVKSKQKKYKTTILLDYDFTILNLWGLKNDSSNLVVLDKNRICRYLYKGRIPESEIPGIIQIIKDYQAR